METMEQKNPLISVIIPVYNTEKYLRQCLDSVLSQSANDIEVICVDDGSTDGSLGILREYEAAEPGITLVRNGRNAGTLRAREAGAAIASGKYIMFIDSDDYLTGDAFSLVRSAINEHDCDILQFTADVDGTSSIPGRDEYLHRMLRPTEQTLSGPEILTNFFTPRTICTVLFAKAFRAGLCRRAFEAVSDAEGYTNIGEDIFFSFFLALFAESYVAVDQTIYRYFTGRGVTSDETMSLRKFEMYCAMGSLAGYTASYLREHDAQQYQLDASDRMTVRMLEDVCRAYRYNLSPEDIPAASGLIVKYWVDIPGSSEISARCAGITMSQLAERAQPHDGRPPVVSVIIPVYNAEKYLRQCLDSVVSQSLGDIEIICVDDGSTDGSLGILREYEAADGRVRVLCQKNQFAGVARNNGLNHARGEYVMFLDSDDYFNTELLSRLFDKAKLCRADISMCGARAFYEGDGSYSPMPWILNFDYLPVVAPFSGESIPDRIFRISAPAPWSKLFNREFVMREGLRFQALRNSNDMFFSLMALALAKTIVYVDAPLVTYRRGRSGSLQALQISAPKDFYSALGALRDELTSRGLYELYEKAFVDFAKSNCAYNFSRLPLSALSQQERDSILGDLIPSSKYENAPDCVRLSIVIPVYNAAQYLGQCLGSITRQPETDIEIICVNDCSTDNSLAVLNALAELDSRIRVLANEKNIGCLRSRERGVRAARGEYIEFVDADDYLLPHSVGKVLSAIDATKADIICFGSKIENFTGDPERVAGLARSTAAAAVSLSGPKILSAMCIERSISIFLVSKVCRASVCREAFDAIRDAGSNITNGEDVFFSFFLALKAQTLVGVPETIYCYCFGRGLSNALDLTLSGFEAYCRMGVLVKNIDDHLNAHGGTSLQHSAKDATAVRMLEMVSQIYSTRIAEADKKEAAGLIVRYWREVPGVSGTLEQLIGMSMSRLAAISGDVPVYQKPPRNVAPENVLVTVIIPVYNVEKYLRECLDSILSQSLREIEVICVNDGSYDGSLNILEEYYADDDRVGIISQNNGGMSAARNAAMKLASGKYVIFVDSDDKWQDGILQKLVSSAESDDLDLLTFDADTFYENSQLEFKFSSFKASYRRKGNYTGVSDGLTRMAELYNNKEYRSSSCLLLLRREWLCDCGISFFEGIVHEDNLFTFSCFLNARRCGHLPVAGYLRRVRAGSTMTTTPTVSNARGYYICYMGMMTQLLQHGIPDAKYPELTRITTEMLTAARNICRDIQRGSAGGRKYALSFDVLMISAINTGSGSGSVSTREAAVFYNSISYRIGRAITFIPRKIRGTLRCLKNHGVRYTLCEMKTQLAALFRRLFKSE